METPLLRATGTLLHQLALMDNRRRHMVNQHQHMHSPTEVKALPTWTLCEHGLWPLIWTGVEN